MKDRNVQYPYRFHVRPVAGTDDICEIIPAPGTVYEDGTFWNKQNVLKDATAALYGKTATAVPDEIFAAIRLLIADAKESVQIASGTYTGTGNSSMFISTPFSPKLVLLMLNGLDIDSSSSYKSGSTTFVSVCGGLAVRGFNFPLYMPSRTAINIVNNGFYVMYDSNAVYAKDGLSIYIRTNLQGEKYAYIAIG